MVLIPLYNNELWLRLIADWRNDNKVKKQLRTARDTDYDGQIEWVNKIRASNDIYFYIVEQEKIQNYDKTKEHTKSTLIGYCGLDKIHDANRTAEISLLIAPRFQSQGKGQEAVRRLLYKAFNEYNLKLIFAETYFKKDFWEKCGFRHEAQLRDRKYYEGKYHDSIILSISSEEWNE